MLRMAIRHGPYVEDVAMRYAWRAGMTMLIAGGMEFIGLHTARVVLDVGEDVAVGHAGATVSIAASLLIAP